MAARLDETAGCGMLHKGVIPSTKEVLLGGGAVIPGLIHLN